MHDIPRQKLRELIIEYGRSLCDDPRRCEALLKDYCGQHKREIFVLISALKNRVADDLLKAPAGIPQSLVLARLNKRLENELAMTAEAAHWAVESWAFALDMLETSLPALQSIPKPLPLETAPRKITLEPERPILPASLLADRHYNNGDGTFTDRKTGLQWMNTFLGKHTRQYALNLAKTMNLKGGYAGHRDWRVPTIEELRTVEKPAVVYPYYMGRTFEVRLVRGQMNS